MLVAVRWTDAHIIEDWSPGDPLESCALSKTPDASGRAIEAPDPLASRIRGRRGDRRLIGAAPAGAQLASGSEWGSARRTDPFNREEPFSDSLAQSTA